MAVYCECGQKLRIAEEVRYLVGDYLKDKFPTRYSKIKLFVCNGRRGCGGKTYLHQDLPLDPSLEPYSHTHQLDGIWNSAKKTRPGTAYMGTTASEYTYMIKRNTAGVSWKILDYFRLIDSFNVVHA
jgi:hypothetical protein